MNRGAKRWSSKEASLLSLSYPAILTWSLSTLRVLTNPPVQELVLSLLSTPPLLWAFELFVCWVQLSVHEKQNQKGLQLIGKAIHCLLDWLLLLDAAIEIVPFLTFTTLCNPVDAAIQSSNVAGWWSWRSSSFFDSFFLIIYHNTSNIFLLTWLTLLHRSESESLDGKYPPLVLINLISIWYSSFFSLRLLTSHFPVFSSSTSGEVTQVVHVSQSIQKADETFKNIRRFFWLRASSFSVLRHSTSTLFSSQL